MSMVKTRKRAHHNDLRVVKLERVQVICPACGQQIEAVASDGRVRGYCAVARQLVDFQIETRRIQGHIGKNPTTETKAKIFTYVRQAAEVKDGGDISSMEVLNVAIDKPPVRIIHLIRT